MFPSACKSMCRHILYMTEISLIMTLSNQFTSTHLLVSPQIVQNVVALTPYFNMCHTLKTRLKHKHICICLLLFCIKDKLIVFLDKTDYVSQETLTRPKFTDSQNFYFHYKLFCIKAVHLSDKLSLTCPR